MAAKKSTPPTNMPTRKPGRGMTTVPAKFAGALKPGRGMTKKA